MKQAKGFTLIELMIAVAVVAILAAVAYPSYMGQIRKGNRGTAQSFLMDVSQRQQQVFLDRRSYVDITQQTTCANANTAFMNAFNMAVPNEVCENYNLLVDANPGPPPTFTLTATAKGKQVDDGNLIIDSEGNRTRMVGGTDKGW